MRDGRRCDIEIPTADRVAAAEAALAGGGPSERPQAAKRSCAPGFESNHSEAIMAAVLDNVNYLQGLRVTPTLVPDGPPVNGNFTLGASLPFGPLRATTHLH